MEESRGPGAGVGGAVIVAHFKLAYPRTHTRTLAHPRLHPHLSPSLFVFGGNSFAGMGAGRSWRSLD